MAMQIAEGRAAVIDGLLASEFATVMSSIPHYPRGHHEAAVHERRPSRE
jgi:hypothetical protein